MKVLGFGNPADTLTRYVASDLLHEMLKKIGMKFLDGRSSAAPELPKDTISCIKKPKQKNSGQDSMAEHKGCRLIGYSRSTNNPCGYSATSHSQRELVASTSGEDVASWCRSGTINRFSNS